MSNLSKEDEERITELLGKWEKEARKTTTQRMKETRAYGDLSRTMMELGMVLHPVIKRGKRKDAEPAPLAEAAVAPAAASEPPKKKGRGKKAAAAAEKK